MYTQEFTNLDENVRCLVKLFITLRCVVGVKCRKPKADNEYDTRTLEELSLPIRPRYTHMLILGDFNLPEVNFVTHTHVYRKWQLH